MGFKNGRASSSCRRGDARREIRIRTQHRKIRRSSDLCRTSQALIRNELHPCICGTGREASAWRAGRNGTGILEVEGRDRGVLERLIRPSSQSRSCNQRQESDRDHKRCRSEPNSARPDRGRLDSLLEPLWPDCGIFTDEWDSATCQSLTRHDAHGVYRNGTKRNSAQSSDLGNAHPDCKNGSQG